MQNCSVSSRSSSQLAQRRLWEYHSAIESFVQCQKICLIKSDHRIGIPVYCSFQHHVIFGIRQLRPPTIRKPNRSRNRHDVIQNTLHVAAANATSA